MNGQEAGAVPPEGARRLRAGCAQIPGRETKKKKKKKPEQLKWSKNQM